MTTLFVRVGHTVNELFFRVGSTGITLFVRLDHLNCQCLKHWEHIFVRLGHTLTTLLADLGKARGCSTNTFVID